MCTCTSLLNLVKSNLNNLGVVSVADNPSDFPPPQKHSSVRHSLDQLKPPDNMTEAKDEIIKAVAERLNFFFSDANIRVDRFMQKTLTKANGELSGSVPIATLLKFNSIKTHTEDAAVVVEATKTLAVQLKLEDDETSIARVTPFRLSDMDANIPLSLFVENLPVSEVVSGSSEKPRYTVTVDAVKELFTTFGDVALVKFKFKPADGEEENDKYKAPDRRKKVFVPAGSAQVEFVKTDDLERAAAELCTTKNGEKTEPPKKILELGGNALQVMLLQEYIAQRKKEKNGKKDTLTTNGGDNSKKRKADNEPEETPASTVVEVKEFKMDWKPGCVISLKGLPASCDREAIKSAVAKGLATNDEELLENGIYADFSRGQTHGAIRFSEPNENIKALAKKMTEGEVEIAGGKIESAVVLEGEEEAKYWQTFIEFKTKQLNHNAKDKALKGGRKKGRR